jgi:hypothetical protein
VSELVTPAYVDRYVVFVMPAFIFLMVFGLNRLHTLQLGNILIGAIFATSLVYVVWNINQGNDELHNWTAPLNYVEERFQEGDGFILRKSPVESRLYRRYGSPLLEAAISVHGEQVTLANDVPTPVTTRSWLLFLQGTEIHDSFGAGRTEIPISSTNQYVGGDAVYSLGDWVCERQYEIADYKYFNGIVVVLLDHTRDFQDGYHSPLCEN